MTEGTDGRVAQGGGRQADKERYAGWEEATRTRC